ncbi:tRNA 2-selenouridine synthase [Clostridiales bacterium oral taxon 876 str. F0540]|nr:tRNA 2-selenouridine synthase [Clostridiales bacterium oral taxon 876 str. F0540]
MSSKAPSFSVFNISSKCLLYYYDDKLKKDGDKMFRTVNYNDLKGNYLLVDVRSPEEYKEASIPGAINIPIFDDKERQEIGYVYVNESVERAKKIGVEAVSKKLPFIYEQISEFDKQYDKLVLFCARGGMRSSSLCSLFSTLGLETYKLSGGYKGYRKFINEELCKVNENIKYIVVHGKTGVGKTELLKYLELNDMDVLDLEEAANHRGSLLGNVGLGEGRSQKQFESLVYETLKSRKTDYVFVEGESKRIGNIIIPDYIYKSMERGVHVLADADLDFRAKLIIKEYTNSENSVEEILLSLDSLSRYISSKNIERYKNLVQKGEFEEVAKELMTKYYDPMYINGINKYQYELELNLEDIKKAGEFLINWVEEYIHN